MAKHRIIITTEEELRKHWSDSRCPNFGFSFNETTLSECLKLDENTWEATYETMEVTKPVTYTYLDVNAGGEITYTLQEGEYGLYN
jgi:hypothetical protein